MNEAMRNEIAENPPATMPSVLWALGGPWSVDWHLDTMDGLVSAHRMSAVKNTSCVDELAERHRYPATQMPSTDNMMQK